MLHVFYGNDTTAVRKHALAFVKQNIDTSPQFVDSQSFAPGQLLELATATSLFGGQSMYVLDTPSELVDFATEVAEQVELLAQSPQLFVLIEANLLAPEKKRLAKFAASIEEFKKPATTRFNAFSLCDSLLKKDKRQLWVELQEAYQNQLAPEEIIGTLWWQLKTLRLAALTNGAQEAGVKDFPYNKAKRALKNFKPGEVERLSTELLGLYHDGHAGRRDINYALERWVLTL